MKTQIIADMLTALCRVTGMSGDESNAAVTALEFLKLYCPDARISHGNVIGSLGSTDPDAPHVLLDAHIDQIGMIVTSITEDGFVTVGNVGGIDRRLLPAQRVHLHGRQVLDGVICAMPPHLTSGDEKVPKFEEIRIDTGYDAETLRQILAPGDSVTFAGQIAKLLGDRFTAPALDDRCGVAAILCALHSIKDEVLPCKVTVMFSAEEEVGERGARIGCYAVNPDIALAVDVSFARNLGDSETKTGKMGEGPMIGYSPSLSRTVSKTLSHIADENGIPWQYEVMAGTTGTNADQFSVCREGVKACTVSIPLRYMHTPAEIISLADVCMTGELLAAYLRRCTAC
ncbi:MAG: M42 family peptidase [Oscillospiraceae bacterium]|nr:M42 family peptidase [Oscillospiraceae bacterium]